MLLASLARYPDRLRGTAIVAPDVDHEALLAMDRQGVVGIRLNWFARNALPDVEGADYRRLFDKIRALGWQVELYLEGPKLGAVLPKIRAQGVTMVIDHFGAPDPALGTGDRGVGEVRNGVAAGDTYVKVSAPYRLGLPNMSDAQRYVDALLDAGGPQQLVWASDFPFIGYEATIEYPMCVRSIERLVPDDKVRNIILADTPAKLFRFGPAHVAPPAPPVAGAQDDGRAAGSA